MSAVAPLGTDELARMVVEDEAAVAERDLGADTSTEPDVDRPMAPILALDGATLDLTHALKTPANNLMHDEYFPRTRWDSNPRYAINVHTLSRRAP